MVIVLKEKYNYNCGIYYEIFGSKSVYGSDDVSEIIREFDKSFPVKQFDSTIDFCVSVCPMDPSARETLFLNDEALTTNMPVSRYHFGNCPDIVSINGSLVSKQ